MNTLKHQLDLSAGTLSAIVPGDILSTTADTLRGALFDILESAPIQAAKWNILKLDLTKARMVDSVGLNLIVSIVRAVKARDGTVEVTIGSANIQRTFSFTRLDKQVNVIKVGAD
jgi:anti-anti-sigma factor